MKIELTEHYKIIALAIVAASALAATLTMPAIAQDPGYHQFVDRRSFFGIPHFYNVLSNLPFLLIGLSGCYYILFSHNCQFPRVLRNSYLFLFGAVSLTGLGSAYYHLNPNNDTLLWDRLPLSVALMAFFSIIIGEYLCEKAAKTLLLPLIGIGVLSVFYWYVTELAGHGDLRWYALVQFLPLLLMPMIMLLFRPGYSHSHLLWLMLAMYALAKLAEMGDARIFQLTGHISGHTIKHLLAAFAPLTLLLALKYRKKY